MLKKPTVPKLLCYAGVWQNRDETENFGQKHDGELIKEDKRKEVEQEIRVQVDELMRQELKNLKMVGKEGRCSWRESGYSHF